MLMRVRAVGLVAVVSTLVAACGEPTYQYRSNTDFGLYYKAPREWTVTDVTEDLTADRVPADSSFEPLWFEQFAPEGYAIPADGLPEQPVGHAAVYTTFRYSADTLSMARLRADLSGLGYDPVNPPSGQVSKGVDELISWNTYEDDGYQGSVIAYNVDESTDPAKQSWRSTGLHIRLDVSRQLVHVMKISCSGTCFKDNVTDIEDILASFTFDAEVLS